MPSKYFYNLPEELIANQPAEPRDSSRLFVYDTKKDQICLDIFANLAKYIPAQSMMVLNDTRVVPSRIGLIKPSGGGVNILFLFNEWDGGTLIKGLPDKGLKAGDVLRVGDVPVMRVISNNREEFSFELMIDVQEFRKLIEIHGLTPLPPYIHSKMDEKTLREKYQSIFASEEVAQKASVAAPTASLHFTDKVFEALDKNQVKRVTVTLHVGRGTFSPVTDEMKSAGSLHPEPVNISSDSAASIVEAKRSGRTVVAVGTTSMRTLEASQESILRGQEFSGETRIFIKPPYEFKIVDAFITNFHLPNTSLLMLLEAFLEWKGAKKSWRDLYELAIKERFRFYSFGDAMLII